MSDAIVDDAVCAYRRDVENDCRFVRSNAAWLCHNAGGVYSSLNVSQTDRYLTALKHAATEARRQKDVVYFDGLIRKLAH